MNRKLKALGLALVAVFALAAMSAATASAEEFHSETAHTTYTGAQVAEDIFTVNAGTVKCKKAEYAGTQSVATSKEATVSPTYKECTAFGFVNTTIDVNGCGYIFTRTPVNGDESSIHIECPAGNSIVVTAFNCEVTVPAQTLSGGVTYTNEGAGTTRSIIVDVNLTGITYIQHSKSFPGCKTEGTTGAGATSLFHDGTYSGSATITGANTASEHVGIW
jgi:hypothetical protein